MTHMRNGRSLGTATKGHALVIVHRGSPSTRQLIEACREKGVEPLVLSSPPLDGGVALAALCRELGVRHAVADSVLLESRHAADAFGPDFERCRFCLAIWDGHRALMAEINRALGAPDVSSDAIRTAQDKYHLRTILQLHGLSSLRAYRLCDPALRPSVVAGKPHIVKPRRGVGSLFTCRTQSWDEVRRLEAEFRCGPTEGDPFEEFFDENELIVEEFFDGRELSIELVRHAGRTVFECEHEKTVLEFTSVTVLERGLASPPIAFTPSELDAARDCAERTLSALDLTDGCYHVELRVNARGVCEIIEINPRIGGGLIAESVRQQYGRSMMLDWLDLLAGVAPPLTNPRACGTYFQVAYLAHGRTVAALHKNHALPTPAVFIQVAKTGSVGRGDREDVAAMALWRTRMTAHAQIVAELTGREYISFSYE